MNQNPSETPSSIGIEGPLETVGDLLEKHHTEYLQAIRFGVLRPMQETLERVIEEHGKIQDRLSAAGPGLRGDLWDGVRSYRQETFERVWQPLRDRFEEIDLGTLLSKARSSLHSRRARLATEVPETLTRTEPPGLYAPDPDDGWELWARKGLVRGWRSARGLVRATEAARQTIPISDLVRRYAESELRCHQLAAVDDVEQQIIQWMSSLEREAESWTHLLLETERILDHPSLHGDDVTLSSVDPSDDPTAGIMDPDLPSLRRALVEQSEALQACLRAGTELDLSESRESFSRVRKEAVERLGELAGRAGTFLQGREVRRSGDERSTESADGEGSEKWDDWLDELVGRLRFLHALSSLRDELVRRHRALLDDVIEASVTPTRAMGRETIERLEEVYEELDSLLSSPEDGEELDLVQAVDHQVEAGKDVVDQTLIAPLRDLGPRRAIQAVLDSHREGVRAMLEEQADGFVVHPLADPTASRVEPGESFVLPWQSECQEAFDEMLFDAWKTGTHALTAASEEQTEAATEVRAIVQFNLGAALQEIDDLRKARRHGDADGTFIPDARELALGGLERAGGVLRAKEEDLDEAIVAATRKIWRAGTEAWTYMHDRIRSVGQTRAHVLRAQSRLIRGARVLAVETGRRTRAATVQLRRTLHRVQRQARRLVRLGHAVVGTTPVDEAALRQTVDTLSTVDAVLADLPLVYRRLFSFRALQDPDLHVARDGDLAAIERHVNRWKQGLTNAIVVTGPAGSGRTSLVNVLRTTLLRAAQRHTLELTDRIENEAEFAKAVAQALNLRFSPDEAITLDTVAEKLKSDPIPDRLRVCVIEEFEHVFLRSVGGTELAARILGFLSETDTRVLWIVTTTDAAWQVLQASEPAATRLVARHPLDPLDRGELEELIMNRHRRSGLGLTFEAPDETTHPILARRLQSISDPERRQTLLRTEYFDGLHDVCGQNIMLALFYWFRSVRLDEDEATLRVRPLDPISFEMFDTLPLQHAFALKALLEHGTLTVGELADVLGISEATGRALLETLGNALVIAPAERVEGPGVFQFASVEYDTRYRIRPLLIHPVTRFLRSRNIVH